MKTPQSTRHLYARKKWATRKGEASLVTALRTHCKQGHAFTEANTIPVPGGRSCRACKLMRTRESRERARIALGKALMPRGEKDVLPEPEEQRIVAHWHAFELPGYLDHPNRLIVLRRMIAWVESLLYTTPAIMLVHPEALPNEREVMARWPELTVRVGDMARGDPMSGMRGVFYAR